MNNRIRIRAFDWCQNQRPWMTLNDHYALCFKNMRFVFGANNENLNEDRPTLSAAKCSLMTLVFGNVDIRGGSLKKGRQATVGLSKTAIFSTFARYFSEALEVRPILLYSII